MQIEHLKNLIRKSFRVPGFALIASLSVSGFFVAQTMVANAASSTTVIITATSLDNTSSSPAVVATDGLNKWFMYNDTNDTIDNTLGSFVTGPSSPFFGTGSIEFTLGASPLDRKNIATYQFSGMSLASITSMSFGVYSHSGVAGPSEDPFLNFNVDFTGTSTTFQKRLVYVPSSNGTVTQDTWQEWDAINSGNAMWNYSGVTWPLTSVGPDASTTPVAGTTLRSWSALLADYPNARLLPVGGWLGIRVGEPGPANYTADVDFFSIGTATGTTNFDFDPAPPPPPPVTTTTVTLAKYLDGVLATASSTGGASFPMTSTWTAANLDGGATSTGSFSLSPVGFNNPTPYEATTADMDSGANYSAIENLGTTCTASSSFKLVGYSTGATLATAASGTISMTTPSFTNLTTNEYIVVWNADCLAAPVVTSPTNGATTTTAGLTSVNWSAVTDGAGGITYVYQAANASSTNLDGSFVSPVYTSGPLSATTIATPGTPAGTYFVHIQATDADANVSAWGPTSMFVVDNSTSSTATSTPPTPSSTPRAAKNNILASLTAYMATVTNKTDKNNLNEAKICLQNSLNPKWWIDDSHVSSKPGQGSEVFFNEECTALYLKNLISNHKGTVNTTLLQSFINGLVADDRSLATTAINEAVAAHGKAKLIANANFELNEADGLAAQNHPVRAIDHYEPAWAWAIQAK